MAHICKKLCLGTIRQFGLLRCDHKFPIPWIARPILAAQTCRSRLVSGVSLTNLDGNPARFKPARIGVTCQHRPVEEVPMTGETRPVIGPPAPGRDQRSPGAGTILSTILINSEHK